MLTNTKQTSLIQAWFLDLVEMQFPQVTELPYA